MKEGSNSIVSYFSRFFFPAAIFSVCISFLVASAPAPLRAQQVDANLFDAMRWRLIGPYRAGRVTAVAGVPGNPAVYYIGTPGGGVWKTTDGGVVWKPIFDGTHCFRWRHRSRAVQYKCDLRWDGRADG